MALEKIEHQIAGQTTIVPVNILNRCAALHPDRASSPAINVTGQQQPFA